MSETARGLFRLLRPKHWLKNALVFGPLIFADAFDQPARVAKSILCFTLMCLISSATYVANDLADVERDRQHAKKRTRPIASGQVSRGIAIGWAAVLLVLGFAIALTLNHTTVALALFYVILQAAYNFRLKHMAIADVFVIATGFVLRAVIGAAAIWVSISGWLLFCTGALALMFGFAKRRSEFVSQGEGLGSTRESLLGYTRPSLDALLLFSAVSAGICYGIYSVESPTARAHPNLMLTTAFVAYAVCRYLLLVFSRDEGEEPESLLIRDGQLLACIVGFLLVSLWAMRSETVRLIEPTLPARETAIH